MHTQCRQQKGFARICPLSSNLWCSMNAPCVGGHLSGRALHCCAVSTRGGAPEADRRGFRWCSVRPYWPLAVALACPERLRICDDQHEEQGLVAPNCKYVRRCQPEKSNKFSHEHRQRLEHIKQMLIHGCGVSGAFPVSRICELRRLNGKTCEI